MRLPGRKKIFAVAALAVAAAAGYAVQGSLGLMLWPLELFGTFLVLAVAWFFVDLVITYARHRARINQIWSRVRPMKSEQLRELIKTPSHPDSGFARVELMKRGLDARPPKEQLFGMLTSGNAALCGQAITYLHIFYPELHAQLLGSSNLDAPELWQTRVAALRGAG
jgi:hypothetical protein